MKATAICERARMGSAWDDDGDDYDDNDVDGST